MTLALGLVGCGNMGTRHLKALGRLKDCDLLKADLVAVVDSIEATANQAADLAYALLGRRPATYDDLSKVQELDAVIVTTPPQQHHEVVSLALSRGIHVLAEKPLSVSVREGREMVALATQTRRILAVAENYRRDPMNRLAKALVDNQVIGQPFLMVQHSFSASGEWVIISPWRHRKDVGGIALDMGVHYADLFEYFCGPVDYIMGASQVVDGIRIGNDGQQYMADAEDLVLGVLGFKSGTLGSFAMSLAGRGESAFYRAIYGTRGSLNVGPDRTGRALVVTIREGKADRQLAESDVWPLIPHFQLDPVSARLFEAERIFSYALDWPLVDANLIAIEQADFFDAVLTDRSPEVDGLQGLRSVALINALVQAKRTSIVHIDTFLGGADTSLARED